VSGTIGQRHLDLGRAEERAPVPLDEPQPLAVRMAIAIEPGT